MQQGDDFQNWVQSLIDRGFYERGQDNIIRVQHPHNPAGGHQGDIWSHAISTADLKKNYDADVASGAWSQNQGWSPEGQPKDWNGGARAKGFADVMGSGVSVGPGGLHVDPAAAGVTNAPGKPQNTGVTNSPLGIGALGAQQLDPNAFTLGREESEQDRANQLALYQQLSDQAAGKGGPSLAQMQLTDATDANQSMAAGAGIAAQSRGLGTAAALRGIGEDQAAIQQKSALQSAELKAAEQEHARQQMAALLATMRGVDVGESEAQLGANVQMATGQADLNAASNRDRMNLITNAGQALTKYAMSGGGGGGNTQSYSTGYGGSSSTNPQGGAMADTTPDMGSASSQGDSASDPGDWESSDNGIGAAYGGPVPGMASGGATDSPQFDTVKALLSPGEIVLPRSVALSDDAPARAAAFVEAIKRSKRAA